ncbi:NUDIX hydrolase [Bacillus cereus]
MNTTKTTGCFTIVDNNEGKILLVKRNDYPIWDLPGGTLEENEQLDTCAIRETKEETGYIIAIKRKIGEYHQPEYDDMQHIFSGKLLGGEPINNGPETAKIGWFNPSRLPLLMVPNRKKQINNFMKHKNSLIKETLKTPFMVRLLKKIM